MDLSQYKTGRFGMRWRTEAEVFQGKGTNYQFKHTTATECMQGVRHAARFNVCKPAHTPRAVIVVVVVVALRSV